jgi:TetR/AcrR family transcriptional repressor of nem operon
MFAYIERVTTVTGAETVERILDVAEELVQTRGLNAMSYADIAERVGIRKASLHYHFPTKSDLVKALVDRYSSRFFGALAGLQATTDDPAERLRGYAEVYASVLERGRMCLCGMLASDYQTLSPDTQRDVERFFERNVEWVEAVVADAVASGRAPAGTDARAAAETVVAGLEGAMLVSRPLPGTERFRAIADALVVTATGG